VQINDANIAKEIVILQKANAFLAEVLINEKNFEKTEKNIYLIQFLDFQWRIMLK
jgi:hypothetical protein